MKKLLIYNYWLIIVSWCMFLNDLTLLAIVLGLGANIMLLLFARRINYWRMGFLSLISYITISFFLPRSNVTYFFPKLYIFAAIICLNLAFTAERLYLFKSKCLKPILVTMLLCVSVLSIIVLVLPNSLYTMFTKNSLFVMISLIILPYLIPLVGIIVYKDIRNHNVKYVLRKRKTSVC